ncbi:tetratricopeptide repeat protein [Desulfomonile tiedjei]|uniref:Uncharacterized protein n=1 Tax=Desulfomonile tiedjei (strain ATCC 49306 / DSM 6799 / DCB-1) TaxID=706587 RepID=I4CBV0_DESTA|nr:hypothetical protein [Desulfomonile tiedjei]AFM27041.1 hypothetical protein Desti_4409 [Desulfomonile tiedjei DSM 6799]
MRAKIAVLACFMVFFYAWPLQADDKNVQQLLWDAFRAEKNSPTSAKTIEKFQQVLKADPDNYYALLKIGISKANDPNQFVEAVDYFLRAALSKPDSPEAYQHLAQLYYKTGYIREGDRFLNMSRNLSGQDFYDSIRLLGWRYEDTGNYSAAVRTYANAALPPNSKFRGNPYLLQRLYASALSSEAPYDWAEPVFKLMQGENSGQAVIRTLQAKMNQNPEFLLSSSRTTSGANTELRGAILDELRSVVGMTERIPETPELSNVVYKSFSCNPGDLKIKAPSDPYAAFAGASIDSPESRRRVVAELHRLRDEALKDLEKDTLLEDKAERLFLFLKRNVLKEYNLFEGYTAKDVVEHKRFISLTGTILYVLIARDANLPVFAVLEPGHAYPVLDLGKERRTRIELTAEANEGFGPDAEQLAKLPVRDKEFRVGSFQGLGEVSDPMNLIAVLYNVSADFNLYRFVLNDNEALFRQAMKMDYNLDYPRQTERISAMKTSGLGNGDLKSFWWLVRTMAASDNRFRQELIERFNRSIELMKQGNQIFPLDLELREQMFTLIIQAAAYEALPAEVGLAERAQRKLAGFASSEDDTGSTSALLDEERTRWPQEKRYWLKAVERIASAVRENPCDEKLVGILSILRTRIRSVAEKVDDIAAEDELNMITAGLTR